MLIVASLLLRDPPKLADVKTFSDVSNQSFTNSIFSLEETLSHLYVVNKNRLVIDAQTEKYLSQLVSDNNFSYKNALLEKTFPSSQGKQLLALVSCYAAYKREEQRISKPYAPLAANQALDYRDLQHIFFGEVAQNLFIEYHNFYQSAQAAGIQLVAPSQAGVSVPVACIRINNVE
jgi:hypothetical protein